MCLSMPKDYSNSPLRPKRFPGRDLGFSRLRRLRPQRLAFELSPSFGSPPDWFWSARSVCEGRGGGRSMSSGLGATLEGFLDSLGALSLRQRSGAGPLPKDILNGKHDSGRLYPIMLRIVVPT